MIVEIKNPIIGFSRNSLDTYCNCYLIWKSKKIDEKILYLALRLFLATDRRFCFTIASFAKANEMHWPERPPRTIYKLGPWIACGRNFAKLHGGNRGEISDRKRDRKFSSFDFGTADLWRKSGDWNRVQRYGPRFVPLGMDRKSRWPQGTKTDFWGPVPLPIGQRFVERRMYANPKGISGFTTSFLRRQQRTISIPQSLRNCHRRLSHGDDANATGPSCAKMDGGRFAFRKIILNNNFEPSAVTQ